MASLYSIEPVVLACGMAESQMFGIIIGTLSSIFVACPLLSLGLLKVSKQDLLTKAKDEAAPVRRP